MKLLSPKTCTLTLITLLLCGAALAQTPLKVGYARIDYIFTQLPDAKQVESTMQTLQKQLQAQIEGKDAELKKKYAEYISGRETMLEPVRNNTETEMQQMQENLQKLREDAQTTLQNKQNQLLEPVYKKIGKGIEDTAKENGYQFIVSDVIGGTRLLLYSDPSMDVSDLILKKLGVTPKPVAATTPAPATH
ncbi:OmpH family outer membrane protein [Chryseolinea lacunae]|uniref:OmpH family outer membrane protein n=1 Tax=Chryseolinea lacunae TaxID=2801331 RepID=A0ABS1KV45_9BACT|nr:OmpH family outer membrane protein [Chryseolinea lacunae]MBL0743102.1 OmpH family outer membrane protein [Chryseolinea lacunae]